jgi:hypothetical protein
MRLAERVARMWVRRGAFRFLVEKAAWRRPLVRSGLRWRDNINMNILEMWWEGIDRIDMAQDVDKRRAVVMAVMNVWVFIKWGEFINWRTLSLSEGTLLFEVCYSLFLVVVCPTCFIHRSFSMCSLLQSLINSAVYPRP